MLCAASCSLAASFRSLEYATNSLQRPVAMGHRWFISNDLGDLREEATPAFPKPPLTPCPRRLTFQPHESARS